MALPSNNTFNEIYYNTLNIGHYSPLQLYYNAHKGVL